MTSRSLANWLAYLEQLHPTAIDMGLDRVRAVAARMAMTRPAPLVVTVTGTNGKGSTCAFIASLLNAQGLKIGSYSSPHLLRYNERVLLSGREASDAELCEAFAVVEAARGEISLTYFEMGTLAAFWLFERAGLDAVVLEVGLGGRLDAVNIVDADLAVITNIGLDHADWLGNSRESVAYEKAGILREGKPALCGDLDPPQPLLDHANSLSAPLLLRGRDFDLAMGARDWHWRGVDAAGAPLELHGLPMLTLPMENAALALQAYAMLGLPWDPARLARALLQTRVVGRLDSRQVLWNGRRIALLLDVGHNPHAAAFLAQRLEQRPVVGTRRAVFGLLADKDLTGVLDALAPSISDWAVAPLPTPRTQSATQLAAALLERGASVSEYATIEQALDAQCARAESVDEILVFGSFYCVAAALEWLEQQVGDGGHGTAG
ncbi:bifunctional tetrahydrofolate synthase/dihydrofolate synthase [Stutzerimonas stutzeri]|jgi:dihydrofolate synthase / folylpolyglutamate synthase|uniref:Dihydrofolate synthase/folylpolyglutamate synthase n=1 Tax=Stutzerimonas stutzeri (strain ATCC 17588 / DSM 5190 / CCUG 11256 / JCM 5965 / LMG 11199 / NBRC 14165 / NCIMB 11358 / Stanier 221) TaxID=96563 RepID=F8H7A4_STUS2|nr:bifunctional tetrahydrofolate synthase/dihydrofolate synthase [Stutzerimonas stutzeri]EPL63529.1 folylpolyglutamate synthetase [Stutzerimonas stutzeri B1SMN1]AEJ04960.1 folylpolyglutamate synthetase [Stutzerimonas stutzeri]MDH0426730.1 bifunctional tetrahydrofolate synthase/dihydrofolate synthase [Stutzerimonas stutzeri]MDH0444566.1 bifunctional tetrahydrofolate synthase/dihydrofolate synthase [Stutzerimonas stutzeri]QPT29975.1 bifunctional tetrahydrofolate synthase/dihydrofolate synthase [